MKQTVASKNSDRKIICSECHKKFDIKIWDFINGTKNPELRQKNFNGEIFYHKCPH